MDGLCEFALHFLLSGQGDARRLVATLAEDRPEMPVLEMMFVLASAASGLEAVFSGVESGAVALDTWRTSALVGVDLHVMQEMGLPCRLCADLLEYWKNEDGFFLA
jgi:hypothetical protein